jgi:hypothetical protein
LGPKVLSTAVAKGMENLPRAHHRSGAKGDAARAHGRLVLQYIPVKELQLNDRLQKGEAAYVVLSSTGKCLPPAAFLEKPIPLSSVL